MGREIRRVPPDWEHPKNYRGDHQPMHDESYTVEIKEWVAGFQQWLRGEHPDQIKYAGGESNMSPTPLAYADWLGDAPNRTYCRTRDWTDDEATAYQLYETVTEGTPISPVCQTREELIDWIVANGDPVAGSMSREQATALVDAGSCISFMISGGRMIDGAHTPLAMREKP